MKTNKLLGDKLIGDLTQINIEEITDREGCTELISRCDELTRRIKKQLSKAKKQRHETGKYAPFEWFTQSMANREKIQAIRESLHRKSSELGKKEREANRIKYENNFIDAAMRVLPQCVIKQIWDEVHKPSEGGA